MITGSCFSAAMSVALATGPCALPMSGPLPPACEVEKKTGSMWSKSFSSRIRCTSTEPTRPRQPTMPTLNMTAFLFLQPFRNRGRHFRGAYLPRVRSIYVGSAIAVAQRLFHRRLEPRGRGRLVQGMAQHQRRGQDGRERIGDALAGDVGRRTVDRLLQGPPVR